MQPLAGKPMLEWIVDALCGTVGIKKITIIGPDELDSLLCIRYTDRRLTPGSITAEKIFQDLFPPQENSHPQSYLLLPCEAVLLSAAIISTILFHFEHCKEELFFPVISDITTTDFPHLNTQLISLKNKSVIPGYPALSRSVKYLPVLFKLMNEYQSDVGLLENSGITNNMLATLINQHSLHNPSIHYFESKNPEVVFAAFDSENVKYANEALFNSVSMPFNRVKVIINPGSGKKHNILQLIKGKKQNSKEDHFDYYSKLITTALLHGGITAEVIQSNSSNDATEIARNCADKGYDLVIAAGGDGTINSVVNGLAGTKTALGVIPLGTINLLAMELGIPSDVESACQIIAHARIKTMDLGKVNDRYFTSLCGIGFDAYVITATHSSLKKKFGAGAFILNGIKNLTSYPFHSIRLSINHKYNKTGYIVIVGNGKYYGASMLIAPDASSNDGLLDVVIFQKRDALSLMRYIWELHKGDLTALPDVEHFQATQISIGRHGHHKLHLDGEYYGKTPVEITIAPSALKVVC